MIAPRLLLILLIPSLVSSQFDNYSISDAAKKRAEYSKKINSLKDSISMLDLYIQNLNREVEKSELEVIYAMSDSPLWSEPDSNSDVIIRMPRNTELRVIEKVSDFYYVTSGYGGGYVSRGLILKEPISVKPKSNYTPPIKSNYSSTKSKSSYKSNSSYSSSRSGSSYRTYYRGPRGGCYYINSNGNKTYVARSKCN